MTRTVPTPHPTLHRGLHRALGRIAPLPVWVLGVVASGLAVLATLDGTGISWDSVTYVQSGINLATSRGYVGVGGNVITAYPPGLPMLAGLLHMIGIPPRPSLGVVNVIVAAPIVLLSWRVLLRLPAPGSFRLVATAFIAVSPVLLSVESMLWSEPLFILLTLAFLAKCGQSIERRNVDWPSILTLGVLCWIAFAVRYMGLVLIPTGIVVLLVAKWRPSRSDVIRIVGFVAVASSVPAMWMMRNQLTDGTLTGPRTPSLSTIPSIVDEVVTTLGRWADSATSLARSDATVLGIATTIGLLGILLVAALAAVRHRDVEFGRAITPTVVFTATYLAYLSFAKWTTFLDPIDDRLLSPVFVPIVVMTTASLARIQSTPTPTHDRRTRSTRVVIAVASLALASTLAFTLRDIGDGEFRRHQYNTARWRDSELAAATLTAADDSDARVLTNAVPGLWVATELSRIIQMPLAIDWMGLVPTGEMARFTRSVHCSDAPLLLALYSEGSTETIPIGDLGAIARFTIVGTYADGTLYRVEPVGEPPVDCPA